MTHVVWCQQARVLLPFASNLYIFGVYCDLKRCVVFTSSKTTERAGRLHQEVVAFRRGETTTCRLEEGQGYVLVQS